MNSRRGQPAEIPVLLVVPPRVLLLDAAGPMEVLRMANREQSAVRFAVRFVGPQDSTQSSIGLAVANIAPLPDRVPDGTLVVLAGSSDPPPGTTASSRKQDALLEASIVRWLRHVIRPGVSLVSICSGALLAARAGLLDGYECTTHYDKVAELARVAPAARVRENRLYVEDGERLSSAGIAAGIDLMLHIVAKMAGHATALAAARYLVVYLRRTGADPQLSPWLDGRNHIHPMVHRAQDAVAADPAHDWSVDELARVAAASPRNLSRHFKAHTGMSITDYVNRLRIALARELIAGSRLQIETVAERAGFASARQFRRAWHRLHGSPPNAMRSERTADAVSR
ncbi:HTH-type transcriptional regulator CdhR [Bradyrhizobium ivorense]|uniref:HTH-type transcriptional regulator CdhR n=1 Tax=Bradyrhizobium ivorense TaxID=2511166 RepID=A0A508U3B0_9BRAD|nr:helix-turn-helix domain-containing protein [Bradyrhizobium ivorense]VIO80926.1 HTH-type transcriptional regulator CdhR [Bradyrhizobium ivorense]